MKHLVSVRVDCHCPPIPCRSFDWLAVVDGEALSVLHGLLDRLHAELAYDPESPKAAASAAEAFARKSGSAPDLTHIFIGAAQSLGIPARFVDLLRVMSFAFAPVASTASCTVLKTGRPLASLVPPLPGVTPPTTWVPYSIIWEA